MEHPFNMYAVKKSAEITNVLDKVAFQSTSQMADLGYYQSAIRATQNTGFDPHGPRHSPRDRPVGTGRQDRSQPWRSWAMLRPVPRRHGGWGLPALPFDVPERRLRVDDRSIIEATTRIFERSSDRSVDERHDRKRRHERAPRKRRRRRHEKAGSGYGCTVEIKRRNDEALEVPARPVEPVGGIDLLAAATFHALGDGPRAAAGRRR